MTERCRLASATNSEPACRDASAKRPRFAPVEVRRTSDADAALSSFLDLSRSRSQSLEPPNDIALDRKLELWRKKQTAVSITRSVLSLSTELPIAATSNDSVTPPQPAVPEPSESLEGDGNALLDDWSCKQTLVFSSRKPFSWLDEDITARDIAAAVLDAYAPPSSSGSAATTEKSPSHLAVFERSRINFVRPSHPSSVDAATKAAWNFSASSVCTQLEHSLTPYFFAIGDTSVLFIAANTIPALATAPVTAIVSQSTPGLRNALKTANSTLMGVPITSKPSFSCVRNASQDRATSDDDDP